MHIVTPFMVLSWYLKAVFTINYKIQYCAVRFYGNFGMHEGILRAIFRR